jgi:hypothetical protein
VNALGIPPGPIYRYFKERNDPFQLPDGRIVNPLDFRGPDLPGRSLCILGDTCDPSAIAPLAQGVDVLVHEATMVEEDRKFAMGRGHSTASSWLKVSLAPLVPPLLTPPRRYGCSICCQYRGKKFSAYAFQYGNDSRGMIVSQGCTLLGDLRFGYRTLTTWRNKYRLILQARQSFLTI